MLIWGRDVEFHARRTELAYHPSVGYARILYTAILLNWIVDSVGFTGLLRDYIPDDGLVAWLPAILGGLVLSSGFAAFATTLVQKPLRVPTFPPKFAFRAAPVHAFATLAVLYLVYEDAGGALPEIGVPVLVATSTLRVVSVMVLGLAVTWTMAVAFGGEAAIFLASRLGVMLLVGYIVADPLHQLMFSTEIESMRGDVEARDCRERNHCEELPAGLRCAELRVAALNLLLSEERVGQGSQAARDLLLDANAPECTEIRSLLARPFPRSFGLGARWEQTAEEQRKAVAEVAALKAKQECAVCRPADSRGKASEGTDSPERPGALDKARALGALIERETREGRTDTEAIIHKKMMVAWVLAILLPSLVFIMKVTAGDRLEPYLRARWAGHSVGGV